MLVTVAYNKNLRESIMIHDALVTTSNNLTEDVFSASVNSGSYRIQDNKYFSHILRRSWGVGDPASWEGVGSQDLKAVKYLNMFNQIVV